METHVWCDVQNILHSGKVSKREGLIKAFSQLDDSMNFFEISVDLSP